MSTWKIPIQKWDKEKTRFIKNMEDKVGVGSIVQQRIDAEFLKNVQPYVPLDVAGKYDNPGNLINSGVLQTVIGSGEIVWDTPYARNLYYHDMYNFQGEPMRRAYWVDRYLQEGGLKQLEQFAGKALKESIDIDGLIFVLRE